MTRTASAEATTATASVSIRSAHHQPNAWSQSTVPEEQGPRAPLQCRSTSRRPSRRDWTTLRPVCSLALPSGASTRAETPAAVIASTECWGTECETRSLIAVMVRVIATRIRARGDDGRRPSFSTKTPRRISPFHAEAPHETNRPGHIGQNVEPQAENSQAACKKSRGHGPHRPATNPQATERYESINALATYRCLIGSTSESLSIIGRHVSLDLARTSVMGAGSIAVATPANEDGLPRGALGIGAVWETGLR